MGSKPLRTVLEGHHADSSFLSLHQSVQAAQRAHKFRRLRWGNSPSPAGWQHALVRGLSEYGWTPQRNWILQHPQEGECNILHDGAAGSHGAVPFLLNFSLKSEGIAICCDNGWGMITCHAKWPDACMKSLATRAEQSW